MSDEKTMITNWPDAIRCGSGVDAGSIFILHGASSSPGSIPYYVQVYPSEYRNVKFNSDGSYNSRAGYSGSSLGCEGKSIPQLYNEGRAFNLVSSKTQDNYGITSMIASWPDAIRCGSGVDAGSVFILHGASSSPGSISYYVQVYPSEYRNVKFNSDGSYNSRAGYSGSSLGCEGKSIPQLYNEGRAFNLVSSKTQDNYGITSMIASWPDAIRCGSGVDAGSIFILHGASSSPGSTSYYVQVYPSEYRNVKFNSDGSYNSRAGYSGSSLGCEGKSIPQLYNEGRAFNLVSSKTNEIIQDNPTPSMSATVTASNIPTYSTTASITPSTTPSPSPSKSPIRYTRVEIANIPSFTGSADNEEFIINANNLSIYGGGGNDKFVIEARSGSIVRIMDFEPSEIIDLSSFPQVTRFSDLTLSQESSSALISISSQIISINNTNISNLRAFNFIFSAIQSPTLKPICGDTCAAVLEAAVPTVAAIISYFVSYYVCINNHNHHFYCDRIIIPFSNALGACLPRNLARVDQDPVAVISDHIETTVIAVRDASGVNIGGTQILGGTHHHHPLDYAKGPEANTNTANPTYPIGISLEEEREIELILLTNSSTYYDYDNDGKLERTSWVGSKDAILVYDQNNNNKVDDATEFVLTSWCKEAKTDFEALLCRFDTNGDKIFDNKDNEFNQFYIWQDSNQNGISEEGELRSLREAGIDYIDFNNQQVVEGIMREEYGILNTAVVGWEDGRITQAYDLKFWHE